VARNFFFILSTSSGLNFRSTLSLKAFAPNCGTVTTLMWSRVLGQDWPYASTFFDYTKRTMPFNAPGSMTDNEVYAVTAFILAEAKIIGKSDVMNAKTISKVKMPNRNGFISDSRPDVFNYE